MKNNSKKVNILLVISCVLLISSYAKAENSENKNNFRSAKFNILALFAKGPYMLYENNNTEMVILWQADASATVSQIEWGTTPSYGNGPFDVPEYGDFQYKYTIQGLTPTTLYYYRINLDGNYETGSFKAAPPDTETSVTIYAYGDTRTYPDQQSAVLGSLLYDMSQLPERRQTIILHAGDWVENGDIEDYWTNEFFNRAYPNLLDAHRTFPIMGVRGNHEGTAVLLRKYWPYTYQDSSGCYYSYNYGPLHVTVIDDNYPRSSGDTQYDWIINDISTSTKPWKIAMFHQPAWGAGPAPNNTINQTLGTDIFESYGVQLVISGHNHNYIRCYKTPIRYITTGGGGAPLYDFDPGAPYFITGNKNYHFVRIDIDGDLACVTSIGTAGEIYDNFCLDKTAPGRIINTLLVSKSGSNNLLLQWDPSTGVCSSTEYNIYRGTLPFSTYNHDDISCSITTTNYTDTNTPDSYYYLVVPANTTGEGSYGTDSSGIERPQAPSPCNVQNNSEC